MSDLDLTIDWFLNLSMDSMGCGEEEGLSRLLCKEMEVVMDTRITVSDLDIFFFFLSSFQIC